MRTKTAIAQPSPNLTPPLPVDDHPNSTSGVYRTRCNALEPGKRAERARGADKVERYNWKPLGPMGEFVMIDKKELFVDHSYQRDKIHNRRVLHMASEWDWLMCGALCVADREGKWYVMDGQHRKLAADKRSDIKELPCLVFEVDKKAKEAQSFVDLNSQKSAVTGIDRFKAMIVAGDKSASELNALISSTGHRLSSFPSSKTVACIICMWNYYKRNPDMMRNVWKLVTDISPGFHIPDILVRGMWGAECKAIDAGFSLTEPTVRAALMSAGGPVLVAEIRRERAMVGKGGIRVESQAVVKFLNRQRLGKKYKIPV